MRLLRKDEKAKPFHLISIAYEIVYDPLILEVL